MSEVLLDIETQINRHPLSYVEDDIELPVLVPANFLFQRPSELPEIQPHQEEDRSLRKRLKFLKACKDQLWSRWKREYLTAFRERHKLLGKTTKLKVVVGDVVIDKNRGNWPLVVVGKTFPGKDGKIRTVKLKTSNGELERPVQHLFPLELPCDRHQKEDLNQKPLYSIHDVTLQWPQPQEYKRLLNMSSTNCDLVIINFVAYWLLLTFVTCLCST